MIIHTLAKYYSYRYRYSRILIACLFVMSGYTGFTQSFTIQGYVLDENNAPVEGATVYLNNRTVIKKTAENGLFTLKVNLNDTLLVQKDRSKDQFVVNSSMGSDSILVVFQLYNKSLILDEVTISRSRVKKLDGEKNEYLLDYYVYEDGSFITIKRTGKEYFLDYLENGVSKNRFKLDFQPIELDIDCKGNSMIIASDSVYQFWMDEKLHFSSVLPRNEYEGNIRNLVYCGDSMFVDYSYRDMNKRYSLNYYDKDTSYTFFSVFDTLAFNTISEQKSAFSAQTCPRPMINDSIPLKYQYIVNSQNRDYYRSASNPNKPRLEFIALQINDALNIQSIRVNLNMVTVDFEKSILYVFNRQGKTVHTARIEGEKNQRNKLLRDPYTDKFYVVDPNRPALGLSSLNLDNGDLEEILVLKEVFYPEKVKVFNDILYFIAANSKGFQKVYMVNLKQAN